MKDNKTIKKERCSAILNSYKIGDVVSVQDARFLLSIFENHPQWQMKKGVGIKSISVVKNTFNRCFQINRIDGTFTDISFLHSIKEHSRLSIVKKACRDAIRGHIVRFRDENVVFGQSVCPFTGEILTKANTHIDHYDLTFEEMFTLWRAKYDLEYLYSKVNETIDNSVVTSFSDASIISDFVAFHNANTKLRAVSKTANLSLLKLSVA